MSEAITNDYSSNHQAVDVVGVGNKIDDVIAAGDGVVEMVVKDTQYTDHNTSGTATYGNFVKIKHPNGKKTLYAHLKYGSVKVDSGQIVNKGDTIGTMGQTGNAYGAHLHFEVRSSGEKKENPNDFFNGKISLGDEEIQSKNDKSDTTLDDNYSSGENTNVSLDDVDEIDNSLNIESNNKNIDLSSDEKSISTNVSNSNIKDNTITLKNSEYSGGSIVDGLKGINVDSSFDNRSLIALKNGITNYRGTYNQNVYLLGLLKKGKLKV